MSWDSNTAYHQGISEAYAAMNAANALGFTEFTIIYYDMEGYDPSVSGCELAANSFLYGWDQTLNNNARHSGVYGSACSSALADLAGIPVVPEQIWFLDPNYVRDVYPASCIPDTYWTGNQRHHQYATNYTGTWLNTTLTINASCAMGLTAGSHHYDDPNGGSACP